MKPKPFSSLNHLTVPVAMLASTVLGAVLRYAEVLEGDDLRCGTAIRRLMGTGLDKRTVASRATRRRGAFTAA
jgi:hypothetical protein